MFVNPSRKGSITFSTRTSCATKSLKAFIDGDKRKYIEYYEMTLAYLSEGGYIIADNTLWDG